MIQVFNEKEFYTYKTIRDMTRMTGMTSKFIKYHLNLGQIYLNQQLFNIVEK